MQETQETQVQSLGWRDPLEKEMATHSSISCLENPMDRGAWWATVHGVTKSWTRLSAHPYNNYLADQLYNMGTFTIHILQMRG